MITTQTNRSMPAIRLPGGWRRVRGAWLVLIGRANATRRIKPGEQIRPGETLQVRPITWVADITINDDSYATFG